MSALNPSISKAAKPTKLFRPAANAPWVTPLTKTKNVFTSQHSPVPSPTSRAVSGKLIAFVTLVLKAFTPKTTNAPWE